MTTPSSGRPLHDPDAVTHAHPGPRDEGGAGGMATRELAQRVDSPTPTPVPAAPEAPQDGTRAAADR